MQKPRIWVFLMILISALAFVGNSSVTVFTGGLLSLPTAFLIGLFVTSLPMLFLLYLDRSGLKRRGKDPDSAFLTYFFALILPSYIFILGYLVFRPEQNDEESSPDPSQKSMGYNIFYEFDKELPALNQTIWSESDLKNLSDASYNKKISEAIREDMKEDGIEFTERDVESEKVLFYSKEGQMTMFPIRLGKDRISSTEDGYEMIKEIQSEYADETDLLIAFTDSRIDPEICISLIDSYNVYLVPESMTRRQLELHSLTP